MSPLTARHALGCLVALALLLAPLEARQIRINRYSTQITEDGDGGVAQSQSQAPAPAQARPTPYPAAGFRPGRAFHLPNEPAAATTEAAMEATTEVGTSPPADVTEAATTTELPLDLATTTAADFDAASPTAEAQTQTQPQSGAVRSGPYPPAGFRPSRAFLLPSENQEAEVRGDGGDPEDDDVATELPEAGEEVAAEADAEEEPARVPPYPAAGYRPSRPFPLPSESLVLELEAGVEAGAQAGAEADVEAGAEADVEAGAEVEAEAEAAASDAADASNPDPWVANHPPCGSNDDPIAPKPAPGEPEDPDAERVLVTAALGPAVVTAPLPVTLVHVPEPALEIRSQRLVARPLPLVLGQRGPFVYSW